jgi:hypothetical protein
VPDTIRSLLSWLRDVGKWWWAVVVGLALGGVSLVATIRQLHRDLLCAVVAVLTVALAGSFVAYNRERQRRLSLEKQPREVAPPGGGVPAVPPIEYQVNALRQVIGKLAETLTEFDYTSLDAVLKNYQRTGTDPVYEPLRPFSCQAGLAQLVELREIEGSPWRWKIVAGRR